MATENQKKSESDVERESQHAVDVSGLKKVYEGDILAVDEIDFTIDHGDFCVIIGPSGCGKTTTLHSIVGKVTPTEGRVHINGDEVTNVPTHKRDIGLVFQDFQLFQHMSVEENIRYGLEQTNQTDDGVVEEMLELMGLTENREQSTDALSAGQQQRVALARSLVLRPDVLLLDEPLGDMDYKLQKRMEKELLRVHRELNTTFVYVTHDQRQAMRMGDQLIVMNDGKIEQSDPAHVVYDTPKNAFVATFVGDSNILEGSLTETTEGTMVIETDLGRFRVNATMDMDETADTAYLVVRPGDLSVATDDTTYSNTVTGTVRDAIGHPVSGTELFLQVDDDQTQDEVQARLQLSPEQFSEGETATLGWEATDAHLLTELSVNSEVDLEADILGE
jgi:ABC-type Fe3+/spermidine/putrescine transport system ATPase subunit